MSKGQKNMEFSHVFYKEIIVDKKIFFKQILQRK